VLIYSLAETALEMALEMDLRSAILGALIPSFGLLVFPCHSLVIVVVPFPLPVFAMPFLPMRSLLVSVPSLTIPLPIPTANAVPFVPCCGMRAPVEPLYCSAFQQLVCGVHEVGLGFSHK
jgi:hypothetical protein